MSLQNLTTHHGNAFSGLLGNQVVEGWCIVLKAHGNKPGLLQLLLVQAISRLELIAK